MDIKAPKTRIDNVTYVTADIRSTKVDEVIREHKVTTVVHLAAILSSADNSDRELEYDIDVNGSKNILQACIKNNVEKFVFTSSGASYGYLLRNNNHLLTEKDELLGNEEVPYAYHKKLVEAELLKVKKSNPELKQYVFRVGTIIGEKTDNLITDLFKKKKILSLKGYESPFCMIWDEDLVNILTKACLDGEEGVYNVAGSGAISMREMADILKKPLQKLPANLIKIAFSILHPLKLSKHGPVAISFLQYRPVLDNNKLISKFAYTPKKNIYRGFRIFFKKQ
jgi:UDP-glucose 4-epimerase